MGFGHLYVSADPPAVVDGLVRILSESGFRRFEMRPELHPTRMKQAHEARLRLFWVSPRIDGWTGVFEHRYYDNEDRERWGYTDEELAAGLSGLLGADVWRLEVVDHAGFWLYAHYRDGAEVEGRAYQDSILDETSDPAHPRYELNRIVEREKLHNIGLGYENIPGPMVRPVEKIPQRPDGIAGIEGFVHVALAVGEPERFE